MAIEKCCPILQQEAARDGVLALIADRKEYEATIAELRARLKEFEQFAFDAGGKAAEQHKEIADLRAEIERPKQAMEGCDFPRQPECDCPGLVPADVPGEQAADEPDPCSRCGSEQCVCKCPACDGPYGKCACDPA